MPKVSVIMPVYNAERFLDDSIRSIIRQTYEDFEFIIINDGSTDSSADIIQHYSSIDSRIKVINQKNQGVTEALNNGIKHSEAPYIARMDADDTSARERLEHEVKFLDKNPDYVLVGTDYDIVNIWGDITLKKIRVPYEDEDLRDLLRTGSPLAHGSVMYRRETFDKAGGYRKAGGSAEDYDLWVRMAELGKLHVIPKTLFKWRLGEASITTVNSAAVSESAAAIRSRYIEQIPKLVISKPLLTEKERHYPKARFEELLNCYGRVIIQQLKSRDTIWLDNTSSLIRFSKAGRYTIADRIIKIITRGKKQLRNE